jgi:hypothetical protein
MYVYYTLVLVPGDCLRSYRGNPNQLLQLYIICEFPTLNYVYWHLLPYGGRPWNSTVGRVVFGSGGQSVLRCSIIFYTMPIFLIKEHVYGYVASRSTLLICSEAQVLLCVRACVLVCVCVCVSNMCVKS